MSAKAKRLASCGGFRQAMEVPQLYVRDKVVSRLGLRHTSEYRPSR